MADNVKDRQNKDAEESGQPVQLDREQQTDKQDKDKQGMDKDKQGMGPGQQHGQPGQQHGSNR
jgi:hypothetical protein